MLDGDPAPLPKKGRRPPIFGPCLLWPNDWMYQDDTRHGGEPRSRPHCARWGPSFPPQKGGRVPQVSAHFCCDQTAGCIKMPLSMKVDLGPGHFVLDMDPAPHKKGAQPPILRPMSIAAKRLGRPRCHLVRSR